MSENFVLIVHFVFSTIWNIFTSFSFPGTNISFAEWAVFSLVVVRIIQFIRTIFGVYAGVQEDEKRSKRKGG